MLHCILSNIRVLLHCCFLGLIISCIRRGIEQSGTDHSSERPIMISHCIIFDITSFLSHLQPDKFDRHEVSSYISTSLLKKRKVVLSDST